MGGSNGAGGSGGPCSVLARVSANTILKLVDATGDTRQLTNFMKSLQGSLVARTTPVSAKR